MTKEIDHEYTDEVVCPYCGYEYGDSWVYFSRNDEAVKIECDECGKCFRASQNVSVDYSTDKLPCLNNEGEHIWSTWWNRCGVGSMERRYCRDCSKEEWRKTEDNS